MSLLRIQIKNQYKKTLSNPDNTNLLYSNSTNRKETPLCASTTASMTIEAAIALSLFVICILSVIFLFRVLELQLDVEYALQYAARKSAIHAHMTHESGLDSVVPIAEAKILFQRKLEEKAFELGGSDYSIPVQRVEDYLENKEELDQLADKVVYTGPIDAYFNYQLGTLEYRSVRFETELLDIPNFQGNAAVNYTDRETPWTRIIEHKWFEFGKDKDGNDIDKTVISREYSSEWKPGDEPYYPVNDAKNGALYAEYKKLADAEPKVIFGGRLGEYKYYDMDRVIEQALEKVNVVIK